MLNPLKQRKLQPIAAYCSSWAGFPRIFATRDTTDKEISRGLTSDCPRNLFTRHTFMSSVGTLDSRRANAHESACQIGSPDVASTIVSAHSPPREICRVSAPAVSGPLRWVMRALRTIQRLCALSVKLSNRAAHEFDVSLLPDGGRNFSKNVCARIARSDGAPLRKSATSRSRGGMSTTTYVQDPEMQNAWPSNLRAGSRPGIRPWQTDRVPASVPRMTIPFIASPPGQRKCAVSFLRRRLATKSRGCQPDSRLRSSTSTHGYGPQ